MTDTIMELVSGYDAYARAEELSVGAAAEAPGTTTFCASMGASWITSQISALSYRITC